MSLMPAFPFLNSHFKRVITIKQDQNSKEEVVSPPKVRREQGHPREGCWDRAGQPHGGVPWEEPRGETLRIGQKWSCAKK